MEKIISNFSSKYGGELDESRVLSENYNFLIDTDAILINRILVRFACRETTWSSLNSLGYLFSFLRKRLSQSFGTVSYY